MAECILGGIGGDGTKIISGTLDVGRAAQNIALGGKPKAVFVQFQSASGFLKTTTTTIRSGDWSVTGAIASNGFSISSYNSYTENPMPVDYLAIM